VLLANKEALVMAGQIFMEAIAAHGAQLLPIDSEHNAVFQCMPPACSGLLQQCGIHRILLTASGGPFRDWPAESLRDAAPEQACAHPNWVTGRKISVDSASMMNKGLELIEACWLFGAAPDQVEIVVHPQSIVHSLVEYIDGSVLAQLSNPDMRVPIAHALAWPERMMSGAKSLNLFEIGRLDFIAPDRARFPCLQLAYEAMLAGGTTTTILNAANEVAVDAFLNKRIRFTSIPAVIETTLGELNGRQPANLEMILDDDARARQLAEEAARRLAGF
jgi:1-deoxy-D-xylulose-5-phosphate reductoisomerase